MGLARSQMRTDQTTSLHLTVFFCRNWRPEVSRRAHKIVRICQITSTGKFSAAHFAVRLNVRRCVTRVNRDDGVEPRTSMCFYSLQFAHYEDFASIRGVSVMPFIRSTKTVSGARSGVRVWSLVQHLQRNGYRQLRESRCIRQPDNGRRDAR
jgi:hypothetical protein